MINSNNKYLLLIMSLLMPLAYSQNFVDDIYYNDSEVNYDFLYKSNDTNLEKITNDSIDDNLDWDEDISYENRIRRFNNYYHHDYYWDYGWNSPSWYNWHQPSWGWSLNYSNYGWGLGLHYGSGWNSPYNYMNYGWHSPWNYGYNHWHNYYYPGHYNYFYGGLNNYVISSGYQNVSHGPRSTNNTNVNHNLNSQPRSPINLIKKENSQNKKTNNKERNPIKKTINNLQDRVSPSKKYNQDKNNNSYNSNKRENNSNKNNSYNSNKRNNNFNNNRSINNNSRPNSNRMNRSNSNRSKRN